MGLRADSGFHELADVISRHAKGEKFQFFPSPGNWGDSLINQGSIAHFEAHGFEFDILANREIPSRQGRQLPPLAVVGGGGGWSRSWGSTPKFVHSVADLYQRVVLLPTSFELEVAPLGLRNVAYFSRDKSLSSTDAIYCPDMAFYLDVEESTPTMGRPLVCLRRDRERSPKSLDLERNWDISLLGNSAAPAGGFIDIVSRFPLIYTDRLHVAIAGALSGRQVKLLDGSYPKSRRVYHASMADAFPHVSLLSWSDFRRVDLVRRDRRSVLRRQLTNLPRRLSSR